MNRNLLKSIKLLGASDNKLKMNWKFVKYMKKLQSRLKWNSHWSTKIFIETKWIKTLALKVMSNEETSRVTKDKKNKLEDTKFKNDIFLLKRRKKN